jgi:hypothetical protein
MRRGVSRSAHAVPQHRLRFLYGNADTAQIGTNYKVRVIRSLIVVAMSVLAFACRAETLVPSNEMHPMRKAKPMPVPSSGKIEVWVRLTEPPVAGSSPGNLEKIKRQQDKVMAELKALGATEVARITVSNNALAVAIDPANIAEVKRISGVRSVAAVQHIDRGPVPPVR